MKYLVSAINSMYYHWQLSLLIESFRYNNISDQLFISIFESETKIDEKYFKNLRNFKNLHTYKNLGKKRGYEKINRIFSMATMYKKLGDTFVLLNADTVLNYPIEYNSTETSIAFAPDDSFTLDYVQKNIPNFSKIYDKEIRDWPKIGPVTIFSRLPYEFFHMMFILCEEIAFKQLLHNGSIWDETDKLAMALSICDVFGKMNIEGDYDITKNMLEYKKSPITDYKHGMPPVFNKAMFKFKPPDYASMGDPFDSLMENPATPGAYYMSLLAERLK